ncbi:MAG: hypothetical protein Aurels2KO_56370 [Aureliella sp.]
MKQTCDTLGVNRSAFYSWKATKDKKDTTIHASLCLEIQSIFIQHRRRYGARRISAELKDMGMTCSRGKVRKIMREMDLRAIQPRSFKPRTTNSKHKLGYSPNLLLAGVQTTSINQIWVGDITYVPLHSKFAYMAVLMDRYSRKIVGWSIDHTMTEQLVSNALRNAIRSRQPPPSLIHHTDRGGQYAASGYRGILIRSSMQQSMSRAGDCYDNAYMESCFGTIETELEISCYDDLTQARKEIDEYVNYYNTLRRHSSIDNLSPSRRFFLNGGEDLLNSFGANGGHLTLAISHGDSRILAEITRFKRFSKELAIVEVNAPRAAAPEGIESRIWSVARPSSRGDEAIQEHVVFGQSTLLAN